MGGVRPRSPLYLGARRDRAAVVSGPHDADAARSYTSGLAIAAAVTLFNARPTAHDAGQSAASALDGTPIFEVDPTWPTMPPEWTWGQVIGIFADTCGYVWTSSRSRISEWDPQGTLLQ